MTNPATPVIGIDVARTELVLSGSIKTRIPNTPAAIGALLRGLKQPTLLVCEATGGYERALVAAAWACGQSVHVANPRRVRDFARGLGRLEKTDPVDADVIRRYGELVRPEPTAPSDPALVQLRELVDLRCALCEEHIRWAQRLEHATALTAGIIRRRLLALEREQSVLEAQIEQFVTEQAALQDRVQTLCLVPGIGLTTAAVIVAHLPELGRLDRRQAAKLAGLAPLLHDSGAYRGQAHIAHGRAQLRRALYSAAVVAARWNDPLREFYQRLRAKGKPAKVAITAVARKLLVIANALLKDAYPANA